MVSPEAEQTLASMCRTFGTYAVAHALARIAEKTCMIHKDNPEAVIHRDKPVLVEAVERMRQNHFLRG